KYLFEDLDAGNYAVVVTDDNNALDGLDQTADPDADLDGMSMVTLAQGDSDLDQDFGYDEPDPQNPDIDIEKSTNTVDADTPDLAPEIAAGEEVTWTYEVTNTGDVPFDESEVVVTDDIEGIITNIINKGDGDNILAPNETWIYEQTGIAQDLSTVTNNVIDFETDGLGNALPAGTIIDDEYQNLGVTISATQFGAMIFDSANPTGEDPDLGTDSEGNILIISEDGDSSDPDDNADGGVITFDLDNPVDFNSINFVDIEESGGEVRTTDADGNITTTSIPAPGNGSLQTLNINDNDVVKIEVDLVGSGAISGLDFDSIGDGIYKNIGTVVADDVTDEDPSHYVNGEPDPQDPGIDIEKFTNGVDADTIEEAVEIAAGETVTWTYEVTNTGDVPFDKSDIDVTDDQEGTITNIVNQGDGDNTLDPNETWIYELTGTAQDLSTATSSQDITFNLTGNSSTTGSNGNVRTFTQDGVSVDVSAFSSNKSGGDWKKAYLGAYGGGLGVTNQNEGGSHHRVDNGGSNDYILFEFDQNVTVDRALLDYIVDDSDISVWIGDRDGDISLLDGNILSGFTKENNDGGNGGSDYKRWANFNADELTGDTIVISARDDHSMDNFKLKKLDISVAGDTTIGNYVNIGTVTAGSVSDEDQSSYTNPEPDPQNPGIDIEKFTNGVDADTLEEAAEIAAGETVTWTYEVTNTGDVPFDKSDIEVTDDQEGTITNISYQGDGDNTLDPGETWTYEQTGTAQDLTTVTEGTTETFNFTGNSGLDGPDGNIRTFNAGDLSVNASAFSRDEHGNWDEGFLGSFSGGLGVTDTSEGDGSNSLHKVDNVYRDNYVLFEFSEDVVVDEAFLASVTNDSDITYWVGSKEDAFTDHNILSDNFLDSLEFTQDNDTSSSSSRWANINNGEVSGNILVIAASTSDPTPEDRFKIKELEVQQVETVESGFYQNLGTVDINGLTDDDLSHYVNPDFSI
ncbi:MAG: hypothetical protein F6K48_23905, partial [Okeania sp. SIO3H1]|nr:hypothetical protein [Okeania sp. SIO3H1]